MMNPYWTKGNNIRFHADKFGLMTIFYLQDI